MTKEQRMIERRMYLHDVHRRQGDSGWHRVAENESVFFLWSLAIGTVSFVALAILTRI